MKPYGSRRRALPAGAMLEVKLEEVVSEAEHKTRELVAHCGLEWDETCLATASAIEIRQLTWWPYKDLLQPLIKELGLEFTSAPAGPGPRVDFSKIPTNKENPHQQMIPL